MLWLPVACAPATLDEPTLGPYTVLVPGPDLPEEVSPQDANNNLDVTVFNGETYLAFRTAPSHFASPETVMVVMRQLSGGGWAHELSLNMDTDLREPRFLSSEGALTLYFAVLGADAGAFEPAGSMFTTRLGPGQWSPPEPFGATGFIPWRVREVDGRPQMMGYTGGADIYDLDAAEPPVLEVLYLTRPKGETRPDQWEGVDPHQPVIHTGGASETDWAIRPDGQGLVAVMRNEAGDQDGWGSKVCTAPLSSPSDWICSADPKKYDSPLVFADGEEVWLIGRRNLTDTGHYDLFQRDLPHRQQTLNYSLAYWAAPKRCALWRVDPVNRSVSWVLDLASRGDTCFASVLEDPDAPHCYTVYNYTSDPEGPDLSWLEGQNGLTWITTERLCLPGAEETALQGAEG